MTITGLAGLSQLTPSTLSAKAEPATTAKSQYYELRVYTIKSPAQQKLIDDYWQNAAIPAYNRIGIKPIGAFTELDSPEVTKIYVLIPFDTLEIFASVPARLAADTAYQTAGADYLNAPKSAPAYERIESSLTIAFDGMKKLAVPASVKGNQPWIFELRTYESSGEAKGINKVLMFNSGEIELMGQVGLSPVFFSQTLIGSHLPNLVYMVSGPDKEVHKTNWKAFFDAPVWKHLIGDAQYKDNVSKVTSLFLKRTPYSQI
ncbi:MAG: family containing protein [Pedosphaera sp.]|nr:family containing protein [Pedosphaera sp.]